VKSGGYCNGVISPTGGGRGWIEGKMNNENSEKLKVEINLKI
jgi:hypothetical protein